VSDAADALRRKSSLAGALDEPEALAHRLGQAGSIDHKLESRRADHAGGLAADPQQPTEIFINPDDNYFQVVTI
jgi:hypothetical protein